MDWEIAVALIIAVAAYVLYKASIELDEQHWPLKMAFFFTSLIMVWAGLNVAIRMAIDSSATSQIQTLLETIYFGYNTFALLAFAYLVVKFIWWISSRAMAKP